MFQYNTNGQHDYGRLNRRRGYNHNSRILSNSDSDDEVDNDNTSSPPSSPECESISTNDIIRNSFIYRYSKEAISSNKKTAAAVASSSKRRERVLSSGSLSSIASEAMKYPHYKYPMIGRNESSVTSVTGAITECSSEQSSVSFGPSSVRSSRSISSKSGKSSSSYSSRRKRRPGHASSDRDRHRRDRGKPPSMNKLKKKNDSKQKNRDRHNTKKERLSSTSEEYKYHHPQPHPVSTAIIDNYNGESQNSSRSLSSSLYHDAKSMLSNMTNYHDTRSTLSSSVVSTDNHSLANKNLNENNGPVTVFRPLPSISRPVVLKSRGESLTGITSHIISSAKMIDHDIVSPEPSPSIPTYQHQHDDNVDTYASTSTSNNHAQTSYYNGSFVDYDERIRDRFESSILKMQTQNDTHQSSIWCTIKNLFSFGHSDRRAQLLSTPSTDRKKESSSSFLTEKCTFLPAMCTEAQDSPITTEYEEMCKRLRNNSELVQSPPKINEETETSYNNMKTVKKKNGYSTELPIKENRIGKENEDYINQKTVKKKNGTASTKIVIMDETQNNNTGLKTLYDADVVQTEDIVNNKECFYSGFDGKRNHYTYVSPKKDEGLPPELDRIASNRREISPAPKTDKVGKKLQFNSPEIDEASTVLHVVQSNSNIHFTSFGTASDSMNSGERQIVHDYLKNTEQNNRQDYNTTGDDKDRPQRPSPHSNRPYLRNKTHPTSPFSPKDDDTVYTMCTMATTGTLHRRTNSTSTFTANSLKQIFDFGSKQRKIDLGLSPTIEVIPQTIRNIRDRENNDDESLISPLGDDDNTTCFNFEETEWPVPIVTKSIKLPVEPKGTYMPKSVTFMEDVDGGHRNCCLEGWLAFSKGSRIVDSLHESKESITRNDLRYIVIEGHLMYVYKSKKRAKTDLDVSTNESTQDCNSVKVLDLSKGMKVEMEFISKRHGHSVCIIDRDISRRACTLLPVRLSSEFFRDDEYSQIVSSKKFKTIRESLFGLETNRESSRSISEIDQGITSDVHSNGSGRKSDIWPMTMPQITPEEQNTAALCLQFALDAASRQRCHEVNGLCIRDIFEEEER